MFEDQGGICGFPREYAIGEPSILCTMCFSCPKSPLMCKGCSAVYCSRILFETTGGYECIICSSKNQYVQLEPHQYALYASTNMFCPMCTKNMPVLEYSDHECFKVKIPCLNAGAVCSEQDISRSVFLKEGVCGASCLMIRAKMESKSPKQLYEKVSMIIGDSRLSIIKY